MEIRLKRVYDRPESEDGFRILVERLWPRGLPKEKAKIDLWLKEFAPSTELRKWFNHDPLKWEEFKSRYFLELDQKAEDLRTIIDKKLKGNITFVYASKEEQFNSAKALLEYLS
jgi:uncharacterized protein YeaO (DUF488 family)